NDARAGSIRTTRAAQAGSPPSSAAAALCTPGARSFHGWLSCGAAESAAISIGNMEGILQPLPPAALRPPLGRGEDFLACHRRLLQHRAGAAGERYEAFLAAQRSGRRPVRSGRDPLVVPVGQED